MNKKGYLLISAQVDLLIALIGMIALLFFIQYVVNEQIKINNFNTAVAYNISALEEIEYLYRSTGDINVIYDYKAEHGTTITQVLSCDELTFDTTVGMYVGRDKIVSITQDSSLNTVSASSGVYKVVVTTMTGRGLVMDEATLTEYILK